VHFIFKVRKKVRKLKNLGK